MPKPSGSLPAQMMIAAMFMSSPLGALPAQAKDMDGWQRMAVSGFGTAASMLVPPDWKHISRDGAKDLLWVRSADRTDEGFSGADCTINAGVGDLDTRNRTQDQINADLPRIGERVRMNNLDYFRRSDVYRSSDLIEAHRVNTGEGQGWYYVDRSHDVGPDGPAYHMSADAIVFRPGSYSVVSCSVRRRTAEEAAGAWTVWKPTFLNVIGSFSVWASASFN